MTHSFVALFVVLAVSSWTTMPRCDAKKDSGCEALSSAQIDANVFNFDCSESNLTWAVFPEHVMWSVHYSTDLNLASNAFDPDRHTIYDRSFHVFEKLAGVLNLSSNRFEHIQEHAFFYDSSSGIQPLKLVNLDLSHNRFESIPWNSLKYLTNMKKLSLKANPIRKLSTGEFVSSISQKYRPKTEALKAGSIIFFSSLQELDLSECLIDYVEPGMIDQLKRLQVLNLASNRLRSLSFQVAQALLQTPSLDSLRSLQKPEGFSYLNVRNNPLECDCKLLWLKKFLTNHQHDSDATCLMNVTVAMAVTSQTTEIVARIAAHDNDTAHSMQPAMHQELSSFKRKMSILAIEDEQFVCGLDLHNTLGTMNYSSFNSDNKLILRCHVLTYPKANIWWTYGNNRVLSKTTFLDPLKQVVDMNEKYAIYDETIESNLSSTAKGGHYVQDVYKIESTLVLKDLETFESDQFSCHVSHEFAGFKARKFFQDGQEIRDHLIMDPIDTQTNPNAIVRDLLPQKAIKFFVRLSPYSTWSDPFFSRGILASDSVGGGYHRKTPLIYWIILGLCILFTIIVVCFVFFCIIRHRRKIRKEEALYNSSAGDYSTQYSSYDWKSSKTMSNKQRSPNTLSSLNDLEATMPLKPDVIRRHIDYSPVYNDLMPVSSPHSPPTAPFMPIYASPFPTPLYQNVAPNNDQSFDQDPVDASIMYENDPNTVSLSSKSFDENIEEYQDPKMGIDLRKPVPRVHRIYMNHRGHH